MERQKHKTLKYLIQEERAKQKRRQATQKKDDLDIFGSREIKNTDIFSPEDSACDSEECLSWNDLVDIFYETRQQYPEVEICEVFLKKASPHGYYWQIMFRNAFHDKLDIQMNDGNALYIACIDTRLTQILGDRQEFSFEI